MPARSQPTTNGSGRFIWIEPERMYVSIGLRAAAFTRTSTWLAVGSGVGSSPTMMFSGGPVCLMYAAFMMFVLSPRLRGAAKLCERRAMEWGVRVTYNTRMSQSRTTTGIFLVILLAVIGYVLVTLPTGIIEQFHHAYQISPWVAYVYAGLVGFGSLLLASLLLAILLHIWKNTRQKSAKHARRKLNPSEMSGRDQEAEFSDNLAAGRDYANAGRVTPELKAEIAAAVAELQTKRELQQIEIVAFGTISSGKSSL